MRDHFSKNIGKRLPHSPQKKALQISVAPFLIFVSQKISQKYPNDCNSTARNCRELQDAAIIIFRSEFKNFLAGISVLKLFYGVNQFTLCKEYLIPIWNKRKFYPLYLQSELMRCFQGLLGCYPMMFLN